MKISCLLPAQNNIKRIFFKTALFVIEEIDRFFSTTGFFEMLWIWKVLTPYSKLSIPELAFGIPKLPEIHKAIKNMALLETVP